MFPVQSSDDGSPHLFAVTPAEAGLRLDELIALRLGIGRRAAARLVCQVRRNGRAAKKGDRLAAGDEVVLTPLVPRPSPTLEPSIVRVTPEVIVVHKPSGLPSVHLAGGAGWTLAHWLAREFPELLHVGPSGECGLAHRLDTGTSGLLLVARSRRAYDHLRRQFDRHQVDKSYQAVVNGLPPRSLEIDSPIGQHPRSKRRMVALSRGSQRGRARYHPQEAATAVERLAVLGAAALVRARTRTGVRHQIRVHLASVGYPLVADTRYGGSTREGIGDYLLHAERIAWVDPATDALDEEEALPPPSFRDAIGRLVDAPPPIPSDPDVDPTTYPG